MPAALAAGKAARCRGGPARRGELSWITKPERSYKQSYTDNVELSIFNCGHEYCKPGHTWGPACATITSFTWWWRAAACTRSTGCPYTLQEGDLFLAKPNQLITYAADETDPVGVLLGRLQRGLRQ